MSGNRHYARRVIRDLVRDKAKALPTDANAA
ncbi:hypothetical protein SAMN05421678_111209, partial [Actinopolymorpha cephalotaxi]